MMVNEYKIITVMVNCINYFIIKFCQVANYSGVFLLAKIFEWKV